MHTCIHHFYWFFIDVFCMYVDFYPFPFSHLNAGPMALPMDDKWQCHPYVDQYVKVDIEVIPQKQNYIISFTLLEGMFYTPECEEICVV